MNDRRQGHAPDPAADREHHPARAAGDALRHLIAEHSTSTHSPDELRAGSATRADEEQPRRADRGPDGNVWYTADNDDAIGRLSDGF